MNLPDLNDCCGNEPITNIGTIFSINCIELSIECMKCKRVEKQKLDRGNFNFQTMKASQDKVTNKWNKVK